jgi:succinate dehydrogenase / fumarate reductase cytochrome b subunit
MSKRILSRFIWSTVGKKVIVAISGLFLFLFVIVHLAGNLTLLTGNPDIFNSYSHKLISLGLLLYIIEFLLAAAFLFHFTLAIVTTLKNRSARSENYVQLKSSGGVSKKTLSSRTMIYSGIVILVFTFIHLLTFKFGPGMEEGYVTTVNGENMRDLYRLVVEVFQKEWYVLGYLTAMIFLGFHLRHAFWSGLQSLGANSVRISRILYALGLVFAVVLGFGFLVIPVYIYFVY